MTDDRIIRVLEEIRDLQRQHGEKYGAVILAVTMLVLLVLRVVARLP